AFGPPDYEYKLQFISPGGNLWSIRQYHAAALRGDCRGHGRRGDYFRDALARVSVQRQARRCPLPPAADCPLPFTAGLANVVCRHVELSKLSLVCKLRGEIAGRRSGRSQPF